MDFGYRFKYKTILIYLERDLYKNMKSNLDDCDSIRKDVFFKENK